MFVGSGTLRSGPIKYEDNEGISTVLCRCGLKISFTFPPVSLSNPRYILKIIRRISTVFRRFIQSCVLHRLLVHIADAGPVLGPALLLLLARGVATLSALILAEIHNSGRPPFFSHFPAISLHFSCRKIDSIMIYERKWWNINSPLLHLFILKLVFSLLLVSGCNFMDKKLSSRSWWSWQIKKIPLPYTATRLTHSKHLYLRILLTFLFLEDLFLVNLSFFSNLCSTLLFVADILRCHESRTLLTPPPHCRLSLELSTNLHEVSQCLEKASTRAFSLLKGSMLTKPPPLGYILYRQASQFHMYIPCLNAHLFVSRHFQQGEPAT